eukprot:134305_1
MLIYQIWNHSNYILLDEDLLRDYLLHLVGGTPIGCYVEIVRNRYINNNSKQPFVSRAIFSQTILRYLQSIAWAPELTLNCLIGDCKLWPRGETDKYITDGVQMRSVSSNHPFLGRPFELNAKESPSNITDHGQVLYCIRETQIRCNLNKFLINLFGCKTRDYAKNHEYCQPWKNGEEM